MDVRKRGVFQQNQMLRCDPLAIYHPLAIYLDGPMPRQTSQEERVR